MSIIGITFKESNAGMPKDIVSPVVIVPAITVAVDGEVTL